MPLLILFSFFLYLFLKCTLEDSDEAGGGEGGPPLSLILTIVSICQCDESHTRCVFLSAGQFQSIQLLILSFFSNFISFLSFTDTNTFTFIFYKQFGIILSFLQMHFMLNLKNTKKKDEFSVIDISMIMKKFRQITFILIYSHYWINASPPIYKCCDKFLM